MDSVHKVNDTSTPPSFSGGDMERRDLLRQFTQNRNIDEPYYSILIAMYSFLIVLGSTGNILVVLAVLRNKSMQTAR